MKRLRLPIKKKWYDMIESGEKTEEYREIKPHWIRILKPNRILQRKGIHLIEKGLEFEKFDYVQLVNGYRKGSPTINVEFLGISIGKPKKGLCDDDWLDKDLFIIKLGNIIHNIKTK